MPDDSVTAMGDDEVIVNNNDEEAFVPISQTKPKRGAAAAATAAAAAAMAPRPKASPKKGGPTPKHQATGENADSEEDEESGFIPISQRKPQRGGTAAAEPQPKPPAQKLLAGGAVPISLTKPKRGCTQDEPAPASKRPKAEAAGAKANGNAEAKAKAKEKSRLIAEARAKAAAKAEAKAAAKAAAMAKERAAAEARERAAAAAKAAKAAKAKARDTAKAKAPDDESTKGFLTSAEAGNASASCTEAGRPRPQNAHAAARGMRTRISVLWDTPRCYFGGSVVDDLVEAGVVVHQASRTAHSACANYSDLCT